MAIKTADLGGTDWVDGDTQTGANLNDTFGAVTIHRKQFSDATERTTTSVSFEDSGTSFTLSVPVGSIVFGFYVVMELKNGSSTGSAIANVKISGSNLGTVYLIRNPSFYSGNTPLGSGIFLNSTEDALLSTNTAGATYVKVAASGLTPLKILDASTTLTIRIAIGTDGTANMKNVAIDVLYSEVFKED